MSDIEMQAAAADLPPDQTAPEQAALPSEPVSQDAPEAFAAIVVPLTGVAGNLLCKAAHVTPLSDGETMRLGHALANVAQYYMPTDQDPKTAALFALAAVTAEVVTGREKLPPKPGQEPENPVTGLPGPYDPAAPAPLTAPQSYAGA